MPSLFVLSRSIDCLSLLALDLIEAIRVAIRSCLYIVFLGCSFIFSIISRLFCLFCICFSSRLLLILLGWHQIGYSFRRLIRF
jgi:hypothetical protein